MRSCWAALTSVSLALILTTATVAPAADPRATARSDLIAAIRAYQAALERLIVFHEAAVTRAAAQVEQRRELLARGIVSRRELEDSERALAAAQAKVAATRQEMEMTDHSLVEALVTDRPAPAPNRQETTPMLVRYRGVARWSLAEATKIQRFFAGRFGRPLPVSAWGQTPLHDRLGFDHHDALDVAVVPDSPEGAALMAYLRSAGYSFIAFRGAVPGEATGAHIHIGEASRRLAY
ncbi:MAG TPA: hypothetical protein VGR82_08230 [Methylomirabilota bacterium]|jgi:hypothetical protein|nr:hypothetical protein [Methylomirabilota bacterium]